MPHSCRYENGALRVIGVSPTFAGVVDDSFAMPGRVSPSANVYLVWVRGTEPGARGQTLGALKVDNDLNGSISGVTALRSFELYVTAEAEQNASVPTGRALLYTSVSTK